MSKKYEESRRMLAQTPKILEAFEKIKRQREEHFSPRLKEDQELMILHIEGGLDWNAENLDQVIQSHDSEVLQKYYNSFNFKKDIKHLSGYLQHQEKISKVIGWDRLIELIVFVIQGRYGCSISSFYQTLFLKMIEDEDLPQDQWSNIIDRIIQDIRRGKTRGKKRFSLEFSLRGCLKTPYRPPKESSKRSMRRVIFIGQDMLEPRLFSSHKGRQPEFSDGFSKIP